MNKDIEVMPELKDPLERKVQQVNLVLREGQEHNVAPQKNQIPTLLPMPAIEMSKNG